jgi:hypothetical protein
MGLMFTLAYSSSMRKPPSGRVMIRIGGQMPSNLFQPLERGKRFPTTRHAGEWARPHAAEQAIDNEKQ